MDCFFPLFLVRVAVLERGACSTNAGAPSWQGNREGAREVAKAQGNPWGNPIIHLGSPLLLPSWSASAARSSALCLPAADVGGSSCSPGRLPGI